MCGRLSLGLRRRIRWRLGARAHNRFRRVTRGSCGIDRVIGVMWGIWHCAGRELIGWLSWRDLRRGRRNGLAWLVLAEVPPGRRGRGGPPGVDADGMGVAASGTGTHDEHGLERSGAKENSASGKYEERQLRSVSLGHGNRGLMLQDSD